MNAIIHENTRNGTRNYAKVFLISCLFVFFFAWFSVEPVRAAGASLSIYPQTGTFTVGSTFDVSVFVNTGGENVNAVRVDLKFDPEKLQVVTPAKGISEVGVWVFPPSFSNTKGEITLQGGFSGSGINTSEGLISVIVFEAISPGRTEVNFLDSSKVLVGKEEGVDTLTSVNRGVYDIIPSPPKGPKIFSESHPDQNEWYKNNSPVFSWEKIEGAAGYSYKLDDDPFGEPDNIVDTESTSVSFEGVEDGILYFHLKAKKGEVWGGTSHFQVMLDTTPPLSFKPYLEPFSLTSGNYLLIYFNTSDLLSGIDHYKVRLADLTDPKNITLSGWTRQDSPFRISTQNKGIFSVIIRAFDKAGNFQEEKIQVRVFSLPLVIVSGGVQIKGIFLPWWSFYILIGISLFLMVLLILKWMKAKRQTMREKFLKEIREAEKEIEDVKKFRERIEEIGELEEKAKQEEERLTKKLWEKKEPPQNNLKS